ncbi:anthranilate phosphoribosyltransferase [Paenibacillus sp. DS2015]|uniref:anthranilate phosphoribosyltransferase n=1 Tax=Paenibacillus sp. DS2015 TaxID=3373917 RepID=UPI003D215E33
MINILKEVARGKRGARDLNDEEALTAAEAIIGNNASPAQMGAFFTAERIKTESVEELEAFVSVCRKYANRTPIQSGIDFAGPYDGRKSSFIATFATAFLLGAAGLPVTMHGTHSLPPKWGVTLLDLLHEIGIQEEQLTSEHAIRIARLTGILCVSSEQWCPPLRELRKIREELGMRTILNTVEKLIDYSHSPYLVYGVFHNTVFERMAKLIHKLDYKQAIIVQGAEGSEDLFIDRPTRTYIVENNQFRMQVIDPETYGLDTLVPEVTWSATEQLRVTEEVLRGESHMAFYNQVLLNGAVRLHLAQRVNSIEEGVYTCKSLLDNGSAWATYLKWREAMLDHKEHPIPQDINPVRL